MDNKKLIIGTVAGGVTFFVLGFVLYGIVLESFFANHAGSATGVLKTEIMFWPLILGNLALAALLSYVFLKWAKIKSFGGGMKAGAIIGFLIALSLDMILYDTTNMMDLTASIVDVIVFTVMTAIGGGVIGMVLGMGAGTGAGSETESQPGS